MDNETKKMFEILMKKLDSMQVAQEEMKEIQKEMKESQKEMKESQKEMKESQKNMDIRQAEIFSVVKAIEHSNTEHKAEIDNIIYKVAHTEGTINKIGNVITESRAVR